MHRLRQLATTLVLVLIIIGPQSNSSLAGTSLRIVAYGDSLTAGLGLDAGHAFPAQLEAALRQQGYDIEIINAGVSGDTASAGLARFDWTMSEPADGVILELGANDALRGVDPQVTRAALDGLLAKLKDRDIPVLLTGMRAPPNMGEEFEQAFDPIYADLAEKYGAILYPFFLDGVAVERALNQSDGIHPNQEGVAEIVRRMLPQVEVLLNIIEKRRT